MKRRPKDRSVLLGVNMRAAVMKVKRHLILRGKCAAKGMRGVRVSSGFSWLDGMEFYSSLLGSSIFYPPQCPTTDHHPPECARIFSRNNNP